MILQFIGATILGFSLGLYHASGINEAQLEDYRAGKITFCELSEDSRLKVCPVRRDQDRIGKGTITVYYCSEKEMFVEGNNLPKEFDDNLEKQLMMFVALMGNLQTECDFDNYFVIKLTRGIQ